ncbi:MAG: nickel/cobalt transporter [Rhodospirillaceae bacterium]|nr:nickel/cobalt transporter [Rhodospirillaceae bacterium]
MKNQFLKLWMSNAKPRVLSFLTALALGCFLIGIYPAMAQSAGVANPFGARSIAPPGSDTAPAGQRPSLFGERAQPSDFQSKSQSATKSAPEFVMPPSFRAVFRQIADWQRKINRYLGQQLQATTDQGETAAAFKVILASFIYGVLHAAGPGHGKMVVASYFTAKEAPLKTGILMGGVIATTQAVVAILMVAILSLMLNGSQLKIINQTTLLEVVSYGLILAIGLYMTYGALTGKATCGHDHGDADEHRHYVHKHGAEPEAKGTWLARKAGRWLGPRGEVIAVGIISGIRPCTGSILVLLFAAANGVFVLGVVASFMMASGVAITISALGIGAIVLRRSVSGQDEEPSAARIFMGRLLSVAGSLAVAVMGGLLFGGALERNGFLT